MTEAFDLAADLWARASTGGQTTRDEKDIDFDIIDSNGSIISHSLSVRSLEYPILRSSLLLCLDFIRSPKRSQMGSILISRFLEAMIYLAELLVRAA